MSTTSSELYSDQLAEARALFEEHYGPLEGRRALAAHAPGRSEIAGNHTDHEGGHVIAGALDVGIAGIASLNNTNLIRMVDRDFPAFEISLDDLSAREDEHVSTAGLARGMAAQLAQTGRVSAGFDLATTSTIPAGGGLSSSAAVEALLGRVMEALWPGEAVDATALAQMSQRTENTWFGKPCGLMDQLAVCLGGLAFMDFEDPALPQTAKLDFDFDAAGYSLCLVDVGCDHAPFTADYALMPVEMQQVAEQFDKKRLCEVDEKAFDERVGELRRTLGDRAVLRAIHYWYENGLVDQRWDALNAADIDAFVRLTRDSGASSGMFLQNVSAGGAFQPAMIALGLAEHVLTGRGAARIHGGGFGGSIQCFVPLELVDEFRERMNAWLGEGACRGYRIEERGAWAQWL
jgi:galactokinase